jgi:hypothetical protein
VMRLWASRYSGLGVDDAVDVAASPDGSRVFVTGTSSGNDYDYVTVAYGASTGAELWTARYDGPRHQRDSVAAVTTSPDSRVVFVAGETQGRHGHPDYATVAYDAATGAQMWSRRYRGFGGSDSASAVVAGPDGDTVFVTGASDGPGGDGDAVTIAYGASTGSTEWVQRYDGGGRFGDRGTAITATSDGSLFVGGSTWTGARRQQDFLLIAYRAATGTRSWVRRYNGPPDGFDTVTAIGAAADGSRVFVTGDSLGFSQTQGYSPDYATLGYDGATGRRLWTDRYNGPGDSEDLPASLATTSTGDVVAVTGLSFGAGTNFDYATLAYDGSTGARLWVRRYSSRGEAWDQATSIAVSPDDATMFVTGYASVRYTSGYDYATIAYRTASGSFVWKRIFDAGGGANDFATAIAVGPTSRVYVTGTSFRVETNDDYQTIAYATS